METLTGTIERVTFYNPENGYSVLRVTPEGRYPNATARDGTITVVGSMSELPPGESEEVRGAWNHDPRYGTELRAEMVARGTPAASEGSST